MTVLLLLIVMPAGCLGACFLTAMADSAGRSWGTTGMVGSLLGIGILVGVGLLIVRIWRR